MVDLAKLTSADFTPYLNQTFRIHVPSHDPIDVELSEVTELGSQTTAEVEASGRRRPFSIIFLGPPSEVYLLQAIYSLHHEQLGTLELFLVPTGPTSEGRMCYEAVFT